MRWLGYLSELPLQLCILGFQTRNLTQRPYSLVFVDRSSGFHHHDVLGLAGGNALPLRACDVSKDFSMRLQSALRPGLSLVRLWEIHRPPSHVTSDCGEYSFPLFQTPQ
jgi:hypothetical protein